MLLNQLVVLPMFMVLAVEAKIAPLTVNPVRVPTDVKLLAVTPLANVAPDNVPAGATTAAVDVELIRPYASVVITGMAVLEPTVAAPGPLVGNATVIAPVDADTVKLPAPELDSPVTPALVSVTVPDGPLIVPPPLMPVPAVTVTLDNTRLPVSYIP